MSYNEFESEFKNGSISYKYVGIVNYKRLWSEKELYKKFKYFHYYPCIFYIANNN